MLSVKKEVEMNRSYNHIKHLVDTHDWLIYQSEAISHVTIRRLWRQCINFAVKHDANQLDGKQRHTGFDYYEYDMPKFGTPGWAHSSLNRSHGSLGFQEHLEDLEHDQARHQGIHGHGQSQTC